MSEYQYYEFCRLNTPLSVEARKKMASLSSRAQITTHGASYVYNYGDFRGNPKNLVLKHFDVFFYIANWGTIELIFKYPSKEVDYESLKKYCLEGIISCEEQGGNILLEIQVNNEEGFGWTEGEGILPDILPLYDEIRDKNYQFLQLILAVNDEFTGQCQDALRKSLAEASLLSSAQEAFLKNIGIECHSH